MFLTNSSFLLPSQVINLKDGETDADPHGERVNEEPLQQQGGSKRRRKRKKKKNKTNDKAETRSDDEMEDEGKGKGILDTTL